MHRVLLLVPALLSAAVLNVDHVTVTGKSLQKLQAGLAAAGLQTVYGGAHTNGTTEMALVSFPDGSYLELMALQANVAAPAIAEHPWAKFLQGDAGPAAWAVRVKDLKAEISRLKDAGISVSKPARGGRQRPDGVRLEWETSDVGREPRGTFFPFLIQDLTPREQRAFPQGKPVTTDFSRVAFVVIGVRDLAAAVKRYRQAYALPAARKQADPSFGAQLASLPGTPIVLAQPLSPDSWLAARLDHFGEGPCAFVLNGHGSGAATTQTRWFGSDVHWFDPEKVGWRLGFVVPNL